MKCPYIFTYEVMGEAPLALGYAAAMEPAGPGTHWMATGSSPEAARAKLEAMWAKQFPDTPKRGAKKAEPAYDDLDIVL